MKRTLIALVTFTVCLSAVCSCFSFQTNPSSPQFDFSLSLEKDTYTRNDTIYITATVTNVSGKTYRYQGCSGNDFIPRISLYSGTGEQKYEISCEPIVLPTDVVDKKVKNGESGSAVYRFVIPANAPLGNYSVTLSLGEDRKEFSNVLSVLELTAQNEFENYTYTEVTITSGGESIHPRTAMLGVSYLKNEKVYSEDCGGGLDRVFYHFEEQFYKLPTLVYNGDLSLSAPDNTVVGHFYVYVDGESPHLYAFETVEDLATLPKGEYLIRYIEQIFSETIVKDGDEYYSRDDNESMFRFVIQ